jgi:uncharacterized protein YjbI with pentapeptide repeats
MSARIRVRRWPSLLIGGLLTFGGLALCLVVVWIASLGLDAALVSGDGLSTAEIERLKLVQELQQLQIGNSRSAGLLGALLFILPLATAVAGVAGGLFALFKLIEQRRQDYQSRVDHLFADTITGLGATAEPTRVAAASMLNTLVRKGDDLMPDLFAFVTGQLRVNGVPPSVATPLSRTLERLLPTEVARHPAPVRPRRSRPERRSHRHDPLPVLALDHLRTVHLDLRGLDLRGWDVDVAFSDLRRAQLQDAVFGEVHGYGVRLDHAVLSGSWIRKGWLRKARLTGAYLHSARWDQVRLQEANLNGAQLQGAELKQAKFSAAMLRSTNFSGADIHEADFRDTPLENFDAVTLRTLLRTHNLSWHTAQFDDDVRHELDRLHQATTKRRVDAMAS